MNQDASDRSTASPQQSPSPQPKSNVPTMVKKQKIYTKILYILLAVIAGVFLLSYAVVLADPSIRSDLQISALIGILALFVGAFLSIAQLILLIVSVAGVIQGLQLLIYLNKKDATILPYRAFIFRSTAIATVVLLAIIYFSVLKNIM